MFCLLIFLFFTNVISYKYNTFTFRPLYCLIGDIKCVPVKIIKELKINNNYICFTKDEFSGDTEIFEIIKKNGYAFYREFNPIQDEDKILNIIKKDNFHWKN